ncbi:MAG: hypothetical protein AB1295_01735 [Candidatus Micrarchaeota archaeon]
MVQAEKEKKRGGVADAINELLEALDKSRKASFTPEYVASFSQKEISDYERAGMKAREMREPELKATPKLVKPKEERMVLDRQMNEKAFGDAMDLATILEKAAAGNKLKLTEWVKG